MAADTETDGETEERDSKASGNGKGNFYSECYSGEIAACVKIDVEPREP